MGNSDAAVNILIWVAVLFVSILVHEFGHALTMRYFGSEPRVVLYMMGGLAIADSSGSATSSPTARDSPGTAILICLCRSGGGVSAGGPGNRDCVCSGRP